jgi:hypothetical protein
VTFFQNFKKVGFLKIQISKIFSLVCETKQRRKIGSQNETFHVWGRDNEQFWWFFFKILKGRFFKTSNFKNIFNDLEVENLCKLVFRHIKLKLLTKASISCLSHPSMSITTWFMSVFRNCVFVKNYTFLHFHRAVSEKLQHIKLWKCAVFHTSRGTSSLPSMNKIWDGRVFSLVHFKWNDPNINLAATCFGAAGAPASGSPEDPDEIVRTLHHKCRISEGREWITVCVLSVEGTECEDGAPAAPKHVAARLIF